MEDGLVIDEKESEPELPLQIPKHYNFYGYIDSESQELKDLYKIVWEIKQSNVIDQAAERAPFIDQTQSMNIFIADSNYNKIHSSHFKAWKLGLKTGIYYLRTKPSVTAKKVTVDNSKFKESRNDEECLSCGA